MTKTADLPCLSIAGILQHADLSHIDNDLLMLDDIKELSHYPGLCRTCDIIIGLALSGISTYTANSISYIINGGDALIIPQGQVIDRYMHDPEAKGVCMMMSKGFFNELMKDIHEMSMLIIFSRSHPVFRLYENEKKNVINYFYLIKQKVDDESNIFRKDVVRHLIAAMICELGNAINRLMTSQNRPRHTRGESIFTNFINLVEENYKQERRVSWYSRQMCISPKYLSETVKHVSGRSPNEWIDNYVTTELRTLLRTTTMSVKEIANEMNFQNQSFLGKFFKEHVGISPLAYRKSPTRA